MTFGPQGNFLLQSRKYSHWAKLDAGLNGAVTFRSKYYIHLKIIFYSKEQDIMQHNLNSYHKLFQKL